MIQQTIERLGYILEIVPDKLKAIPAAEFTFKPGPAKWSKQEIIGHLIDSAANNHQRFLRVQFEDNPLIRYDQNQWNAFSHYNEMDGNRIIDLWTAYNKHLMELMKFVEADKLERLCEVGSNEPVTLEYLINDYVVHMEHHLRQVLSY